MSLKNMIHLVTCVYHLYPMHYQSSFWETSGVVLLISEGPAMLSDAN